MSSRERSLKGTCSLRSSQTDNCPLQAESELRKTGWGSCDYQRSEEGMLLVKWFDANKELIFGSNHHAVEPQTQVPRFSKAKKGQVSIAMLAIVRSFNKGMEGTERCRNLLASHRIRGKGKKWQQRVLFHFIDVALVNAFILSIQVGRIRDTLPLYEFKLNIALALMYGDHLGDPLASQAVGLWQQAASAVLPPELLAENGDPLGRQVCEAVRLDCVNHFPDNVAEVARRCRLRGCTKRSTIWCAKCRVYLCLKKNRNCFTQFHIAQSF